MLSRVVDSVLRVGNELFGIFGKSWFVDDIKRELLLSDQ